MDRLITNLLTVLASRVPFIPCPNYMSLERICGVIKKNAILREQK